MIAMTKVTEQQWQALATDESLVRALPDDLRALVLTPLQALFLAADPENETDPAKGARLLVDIGNADADYLGFLRVQIKLKPRGENWNRLLKDRLAFYEHRPKVYFHLRLSTCPENSLSAYLDESNRLLYWEVLAEDFIAVPAQKFGY